MSRNRTTYIITTPTGETLNASFRWTISRGRDTYGYNICTLYIDGQKVSRCDGGGYDMEGTCLGIWLENHARPYLLKLAKEFYGLTFHDPNFNPGKAVLPSGKTVEEAEKSGESLGLDRYQQFYRASSKTPTERHAVPRIDGACGMSCVQDIGKACGYVFKYARD
jgi:hypothetical protein